MARLNASSPPVHVASNQNQDEEEVVEEGNWEQFVYAEQLIADSVKSEDQGETQFPLLLREQLDAEQNLEEEGEDEDEDEDEDVSENVLNVLNNATSTPRISNRAPEEVPPLSIQKRITGLFSEGMRLLGSGSRADDNDITEDTSPSEARDDTMQPPATTTSASKAPKKLIRPSVLHQPLNTYKLPPQSSGKPDVYEVNGSPEKVATTSTRTQSKQAQGVKRKRNNPAAAKKPPPRGKTSSPGLVVAATKEREELQPEVPSRVTRSRGSGEIIEPIDYSRKVEDAGKRKRSGGAVDDKPPSKESRKRTKKVVEDETNESEDGDRPSTPSKQNRAEDIPSEEATPNASDKGSQSGAASGPSDATARRTKKGKNAIVEDKEDSGDEEFQDDGSDLEDDEDEEESESKSDGKAPASPASPRWNYQGERKVPIKSPYFGDAFITESNIEKIITQIDKLEMRRDPESDPEELESAKTYPGREIQVLTRNIISSYESIQGLDEHDDPDPASRSEALCSAARDLDRLEVTVRGIMENWLCSPAELAADDKHENVGWRRRMLKDLFLFAMPDITRAASAAIFTYGYEGSPSTPDLKEILRCITLVSRLLLIAEDPHNKNLRPRANKNEDYSILKPYQSIKPLLRGFEMQCKQELRYREDLAEAKRQAPILEREQREQREREEADRLVAEEAQIEYQRRQEEVNDAYNRHRMKLGLAPVSLDGSQMPQNTQSSEPPQPNPERERKEREEADRLAAEEARMERKKRVEADRLAAEEARVEYQRRQEEVNDEYNRHRMKYGLAPVPLAGSQMSQNLQSSEPPHPSQPQHTQELNITMHRRRAEQEVSVLAKEVNVLKTKLEAAERRVTKLRREEQRQFKGYDAEETHEADYERVEMFPAGNNHALAAEPWTATEYEVLADGLRLETGMSRFLRCCSFLLTNLRAGPDKYPNIARRLDRSLDEIFEKAKEFKRVMIEGLYMKNGDPVEPWIEIIGNEMPRGRE